jgi:glycosyltransferase involved in cell wall biosynthesis
MIAAGHIDEQVRLKGALNGKDLKHILATGQLFAMPFAHEGFGIACLEALAFGLPVLASTAGAANEFIRDGVNGYLIPPGESRMCARIISDLHRDRKHLLRLSEGALKTALDRPGWSDTLDAIHYFLTHLPKQHRTPGAFRSSL